MERKIFITLILFYLFIYIFLGLLMNLMHLFLYINSKVFPTCSEEYSYFDLPFCSPGGKNNFLTLLVCGKIINIICSHIIINI